MKQLILFFISLLTILTNTLGQQKLSPKLKPATIKYAGTYGFGKSREKGTGEIIIYPETDSTVLFYLEGNRGAPSYSNGTMYQRLTISKDSATFFMKKDYQVMGCQWKLKFRSSFLTIETIDGRDECEFGYGVIADGKYIRKSSKIPSSFVTMDGQKVFFKSTSPEAYNSQ